jgi:hypothetical protein
MYPRITFIQCSQSIQTYPYLKKYPIILLSKPYAEELLSKKTTGIKMPTQQLVLCMMRKVMNC